MEFWFVEVFVNSFIDDLAYVRIAKIKRNFTAIFAVFVDMPALIGLSWNLVLDNPSKVKVKVKRSLEASRKFRLRDFKTIATWRCCKASPRRRLSLPPRKYSWLLISVRGWVDPRGHSAGGRIMSIKKIPLTLPGNRTRDLPACSAVP